MVFKPELARAGIIARMSRPTARPARPPGKGVPEVIGQDERTRELPGPAPREGGATGGPGAVAAPAEMVTTEETVPVQSCIESSLLHEVLLRQSAEQDEEDKAGGEE
jgi:hypothetical protein